MITTLTIVHVVVSVLLIIMVLLQFGKGAEAGLMGGSSDSVFTSSQQGNILTKITVVLATVFMVNCVVLAKLQSKKSSESLLDGEAPIARPLNSDAQTKAMEDAKKAVDGAANDKKEESKAAK